MPTLGDYEEIAFVPRIAIKFPLALPVPDGFDPVRLETWPKVEGRLEYVQGRLLYMPPCGDGQGRTVARVVTALGNWEHEHPEFVVSSNEVGILLGGNTRGADAAAWRTRDLGPWSPGVARVPPVLAVEVAGKDDTVEMLTEKAHWYLKHGVEVVWILVPASRTVHVITKDGTTVVGTGARVPSRPSLPGLDPLVDDLFGQLSRP